MQNFSRYAVYSYLALSLSMPFSSFGDTPRHQAVLDCLSEGFEKEKLSKSAIKTASSITFIVEQSGAAMNGL